MSSGRAPAARSCGDARHAIHCPFVGCACTAGRRSARGVTSTSAVRLAYGGGESSTPWIRPNIAAAAPMPKASVITATAVNPGFL